jgi:hypothetical protein
VSYIYVDDDSKFDDLIDLVKKQKKRWDEKYVMEAAGIVTLKEDVEGNIGIL